GGGECIVCHLGAGAWMIVDSARTRDGAPVALVYLRRLGVEPAKVRLVVASHFHSDHVDGLTETFAACPHATFATSAALSDPRFGELVQLDGPPAEPRTMSLPLSEYEGALHELKRRRPARRKLELAVPGRALYPARDRLPADAEV